MIDLLNIFTYPNVISLFFAGLLFFPIIILVLSFIFWELPDGEVTLGLFRVSIVVGALVSFVFYITDKN